MEWYDCTDPEELVLIAAAVGIAMSKNLTINQINSLGNFFEMLGQNMLTIAAQRQLVQNKCTHNADKSEGENEIIK